MLPTTTHRRSRLSHPAVKDLAVRIWACPSCGVIHDRDVNAATNLYPNESRIAAARTIRLTEREKSAKKRRSQKARSAKSAATKLINSEAARLAKHEEKMIRAAGRRQSKIKSKTLTVTPTDSKARRGLVRPKEMTVVVSAARVAQATPMARTVNPSDREEARTKQDDRRQMTVDAVRLGALDAAGEIPHVSSV